MQHETAFEQQTHTDCGPKASWSLDLSESLLQMMMSCKFDMDPLAECSREGGTIVAYVVVPYWQTSRL